MASPADGFVVVWPCKRRQSSPDRFPAIALAIFSKAFGYIPVWRIAIVVKNRSTSPVPRTSHDFRHIPHPLTESQNYYKNNLRAPFAVDRYRNRDANRHRYYDDGDYRGHRNHFSNPILYDRK